MALVEQGGGGLPPPRPPGGNKGFFSEGTDVIHNQNKKATRLESEASAGPDAYWVYRAWMLDQIRENPMLNPNWRPPPIHGSLYDGAWQVGKRSGRGAAPSLSRSFALRRGGGPEWLITPDEFEEEGWQRQSDGSYMHVRHQDSERLWRPTFRGEEVRNFFTREQTGYYSMWERTLPW